MATWYVSPILLVCLSQLRALFCLITDDSVHGKRREGASDYKDETSDKEANATAFVLLKLL